MSPELSTTTKNLFGETLRERGLTPEELAASTGLEPSAIARLAEDPRRLPDPVQLGAACLALDLPLEALVRFDPDPAPLAALLRREPTPDPVQVTVCGGGNLGHVFAGLLSRRADLRVHWLVSSSKAVLLRERVTAGGGLRIRSRHGEVTGTPALITDDAAEAVRGSELILLCLPSHVEPEVLARIAPHVKDGALVGAIPAPGGFHWAARAALEKAGRRATVFGLASIPWMCKADDPGRVVRILGQKTLTGLAAWPSSDGPRARDVLSHLLGIPVLAVGSFLEIILNPANQLLHPGIMFDLFAERGEVPFAEPPLFYESLSERGADLLEAMSDETLRLREALEAARPGRSLSGVLPIGIAIRAAYGDDIADGSSLRSIIATNRAYAGIRTPLRSTDRGFVIEPSSRFFGEDIPYGLVVLRGMADLLGVRVPEIDRVLVWAQAQMGKQYLVDGKLEGRDLAESGAPQRYGIRTAAALWEEA